MTLEKAIEILRDSIADNTLLITLEHDAAVKLGIEALKRLNLWRECGDDIDTSPLPGEE